VGSAAGLGRERDTLARTPPPPPHRAARAPPSFFVDPGAFSHTLAVVPLSPLPSTQFLVDKILRTKIQETTYWKQHCFGASAAAVVDLAADLEAVGGTTTALRRPTPFLCLLLKLLQLGPSRDVVAEYVSNPDLKYLRVLGALYARLAWRPADVFLTLEPLLADFRRLRAHAPPGSPSTCGYELTTVDAVVDALLTESTAFDVALPRLPPRKALEDTGALPGPRASPLDAAADAAEAAERAGRAARGPASASPGREVEEGEEGEVGGRRGGRGEGEGWRRGGDRDRRCRDDDDNDDRRRSRSRERERERERERRPREKWRRSPSPERRRARRREEEREGRRGRERERGRERSPPPPPPRGGGGGKSDAMSVDETNALRAKLGLAPLK